MDQTNGKTVAIITFEKKDNREKDSIGSSRIRGKWLWENWDEAEEFWIGKNYETVIFQKVYWMSFASQFEGIKIFDLCDPDSLDGRPVVEMMSLCDACTFSTEALKNYYSKLTDKPCYVIPDRINIQEHDKYKRGEHTGRARTAVWVGYSHNSEIIEKAFPILNEKQLDLTIISDNQITFFGEKQPKFVKYAYPKVHADIAKSDLMILPEYSSTDARQKYKSNNKDITAWALGVPVVKVPDDLDHLMEAENRNKEVSQWQEKIIKEYDVRLSVDQMKGVIEDVKRIRQTAI